MTAQAAAAAAIPENQPAYPSENNNDMFGRRKRKLSGPASAIPPTLGKIRIKWGRKGLVRFLSHLENNRVFERAIRRAELPVAYSLGYHPHQKLSFGPPLPVGYSSDCEYLDIQIDGNCTKDHLAGLARVLPEGFFIHDFKLIYSKAPAISALLNRATYYVFGRFGDLELLERSLAAVLARDSIIVTRGGKETSKDVEIRPAIYHLGLSADAGVSRIEMELGLGQGGYARPNEVMEALGLFPPEQLPAFHFHRRELRYLDEFGTYLDPLSILL